jgi:feruloyl-CoA synthase
MFPTSPGHSRHTERLFKKPAVAKTEWPEGTIILRSTVPLQSYARCVGDWLERWARQAPQRIFLGERSSADTPWTTVTYADALRQARSAGAWILARDMSAERPLVILSDNSIEHALFALGAMHVGVPVASISPAYSLMSKDFDKLKSMIALLDPGAIYVADLKMFAPALAAIKPLHTATVVSGDAEGKDAISFRIIAATLETDASRGALRPSVPTLSLNSCSPRVRPARRRLLSTPNAC